MPLVDNLIAMGYLRTPVIIEAFCKIKRVDFLPEGLKEMAELDQALPIGKGQTISQPAVVAFMLELLQPQPGDKILDIGSGSGWTTALLAEIVSKKNKKGKVFAIEIIKELKSFGEQNVSKYNFIKKGVVKFIEGDGNKGLKSKAPFDKILVSAATKNVPDFLKEQLKEGGKLVIPVEEGSGYFSQSIWLIKKEIKNKFKMQKYPGFVFVPLVKKNN